MTGFIDYVVGLERLALSGRAEPAQTFAPALDGEAGRELRRMVDLETRRDFGAFFTGSEFAGRLVARADGAGRFQDPSCGAGDLLLAAARRLPMAKTLRGTLSLWSRHLVGFDLHAEFIRATKARLVLMARSRGVFTDPLLERELKNSFPGIVRKDALAKTAKVANQATLLMNPPYFAGPPRAKHEWWGVGQLNTAAEFVARYLDQAKGGTQLLAILPEVLRSGSNYAAWRTHIASQSASLAAASWGRFDANADVDVFMLDLRKRGKKQPAAAWPGNSQPIKALSARFEVSVGAVVPHRDKKRGSVRRFLDARAAPTGEVVRRIKSKRKFKGTVVKPPFVVVKRTSRPGDKFRAAPTVVTGTRPVAVENHLIVCRPKDGTIASCLALARRLQTEKVNRALNRTIRCRHLTVGAVSRIDVGDL